jgi:hypothetical protein
MRRQDLDEQARLLADRTERGSDPSSFLRVFPPSTQRAILRRAVKMLEERREEVA